MNCQLCYTLKYYLLYLPEGKEEKHRKDARTELTTSQDLNDAPPEYHAQNQTMNSHVLSPNTSQKMNTYSCR
jgi:hypothetical protein